MPNRGILLLLIVLLTACQGNNDDGGLELSDEQLKQLMKSQPPMPGQGGDDQGALLQLELAYQSDSNDLDNVYNLAFIYCNKCVESQEKQNCQSAIQYLSRSINLKSKHRDGAAYFNRALCYAQLNNYEAALKDIDQFIPIYQQVDTPKVNYWTEKAILLHKMDKIEEACNFLQKAIALDSTGISSISWSKDCVQ